MLNLNWLPVRKEELPLTLSLSLLHFLIIASFTLGKITRDSLFLSELPVEYLPYVYMGLAAFAAIAVGVFGKLGKGTPTHKLLFWALLGTALSLLLFSFWFRLAEKTAAIAYYFWLGAYGPLLVSQFWILANERINSRQAKRLFGVIGAGGILGGLIGGAVATSVARLMPTSSLLGIIAVLHALASVVAARSGVRREEAAPIPKAEGIETEMAGPGLFKDSYVRILVALFLVVGVTSAFLDYAFKVVLQQQLKDAQGMTSVLGIFYGVQNVVAFVAQIGLAGVVLKYFGNRVGSTTMSGGVWAGAILSLALPIPGALPWGILGTRLYESMMRVSLARTSWEFLYYPLSDEIKRRAKPAIDVVVNKSSEALAGIIILLLNFLLGGGLFQLAVVIVVLASLWFLLELKITSVYAKEVARALEQVVGKGDGKTVTLREIAEPEKLVAVLKRGSEAQVVYVLGVLESISPESINQHAAALLRHPSQAVRARVLGVLYSENKDIADYESDREVTSSELAGEEMVKVYHETTSERLVMAAGARSEADKALQLQQLVVLMNDEDPQVRKVAYHSAGQSKQRSLIPHLIAKLSNPGERKHARRALVLYGQHITGTLGDYLQDPDLPVTARNQICSVLVEMGGQNAAYSLYRATGLEVDRRVANEALRALTRMREEKPEVLILRLLMFQDLQEDMNRYCQRIVQRESLRVAKEPRLAHFIERVLTELEGHCVERIFRRLALVYDARETLSAYRGYSSANARLRAQAMEYLDTALPPDIKKRFLPVLEALSEEERARLAAQILGVEPSLERLVEEFLQSRESWLRACGLHIVGYLKLINFRAKVEALSGASDPLLRETQAWAMGRLETLTAAA